MALARRHLTVVDPNVLPLFGSFNPQVLARFGVA